MADLLVRYDLTNLRDIMAYLREPPLQYMDIEPEPCAAACEGPVRCVHLRVPDIKVELVGLVSH